MKVLARDLDVPEDLVIPVAMRQVMLSYMVAVCCAWCCNKVWQVLLLTAGNESIGMQFQN